MSMAHRARRSIHASRSDRRRQARTPCSKRRFGGCNQASAAAVLNATGQSWQRGSAHRRKRAAGCGGISPAGPCCILTVAASHASRRAVSAETWMPPASSSTVCPRTAGVGAAARGPGQGCDELRAGQRRAARGRLSHAFPGSGRAARPPRAPTPTFPRARARRRHAPPTRILSPTFPRERAGRRRAPPIRAPSPALRWAHRGSRDPEPTRPPPPPTFPRERPGRRRAPPIRAPSPALRWAHRGSRDPEPTRPPPPPAFPRERPGLFRASASTCSTT